MVRDTDWAEFFKRYMHDHPTFRDNLRAWIGDTNTAVDDHETRIDDLESSIPSLPVSIANGDTGQVTASAAVDALGGAASTGTGGLVRATSPTLVTPALGTPASGSLVNCGNLAPGGVTGTALVRANDLSDVSSAATARSNLGLAIGSDVPDYDAPRVHHTFCFTSTAATAAGARTVGIISSTAIASRNKVPSGKSFLVLGVSASVESGATAGTYTVKAVIYNHTDATETTLATFPTFAASTVEHVEAVGTISSPLATISASRTFSVGWANDASSPGALSTNARSIFVTGIFV